MEYLNVIIIYDIILTILAEEKLHKNKLYFNPQDHIYIYIYGFYNISEFT